KVFAGTGDGGVFFSSDGGDTWTARNTDLEYLGVNEVELNPSSPSTVYAGTLGGVFRSTTRGQDWNERSTGLERTQANAVAVNPNNPDIVYQGAEGGGILKTKDGGT